MTELRVHCLWRLHICCIDCYLIMISIVHLQGAKELTGFDAKKDIKEGDRDCPECPAKLKSTSGLRRHYRKFHVGNTKYR